ncbi:MAG TPA: hypothetical protein VN914_06410 [Polyangia bacterium]|nr:hypothetical protein [Polyangia bacterium]
MKHLCAAIVLLIATRALAAPDPAGVFAGCREGHSTKKMVKIQLKPNSTLADVVSLLRGLSCHPVELDDDVARQLGKPTAIGDTAPLTFDQAFRLMQKELATADVEVVATSREALRIQRKR